MGPGDGSSFHRGKKVAVPKFRESQGGNFHHMELQLA